MSSRPTPEFPARIHAGAWRLNGVVWGLLLVDGLAVAATSGSYATLGPLMILLPLAGIGLAANLMLFCWKLVTRRFRQALGYGIGFMLLTVFFVGIYLFLNAIRIEKWW
ncbi:hypothetical protein [Hymenobacter jeollabukensis]|uniref:Uncharacterized protein n=1 Tax=Hymenobacter jeollabukensis TaxID=2025313 RepID=A0A5R8WWY3_9BACT|nr:hypothetical protein [Hymenobacter jeollabukensis]TLM96859.1 hypothetical protein FDY95_02385 [Hymenobacter jeollabukensis]